MKTQFYHILTSIDQRFTLNWVCIRMKIFFKKKKTEKKLSTDYIKKLVKLKNIADSLKRGLNSYGFQKYLFTVTTNSEHFQPR